MYLSLNGEIIPVNGYVLISNIGSNDESALLCHTNRLPSPGDNINSGGNWFAPNGTRVNYDDVPGVIYPKQRSSRGETEEDTWYCSWRNVFVFSI